MIDLNGIKLKNRFLVSSGALEYGRGWPWERPLIKLGLIDPSIFGGVVTKTLTLKPNIGNYIDPFEFEKSSLMPHLCRIFMSYFLCRNSPERQVLQKIPDGWRNNLGWWNVGINYYVIKIYPEMRHDPKMRQVTIIVSIGGYIVDHYLELIRKLNPLDIAAVELNISCPNVENPLAKNPSEELVKFFSFCREASAHPLIVKLGIDCDYIQVARIAEYCGINALSAINAIPILRGGYSGPGIKPIALKVVSDLKKKTGLPVIGGGGIESWKDCQELFQVGADAVSFGSVHFFQPWKPTWIVKKHAK